MNRAIHDAFPSEMHGSGLSVREYFAARAPAVPQPWFNPIMGEVPVVPRISEIEDPELRLELRNAWDGDYDPTTPAAIEWMERYKTATASYEAWSANRKIQREIQWPWAWADAVLSVAHLKAGAP